MHSLDRLSKRLRTLQETTKDSIRPIITFDKDDVDTLDFVAASANLRSAIFGIEAKSKFDIKRTWISVLLSLEVVLNNIMQRWLEILSPRSQPRML